jgi:EAL domain-containing protein (putative c-di-GMP-specific phosphodiesterase class I)
VNLAPLQLEQPNLTEIVSDILRRTGIPGEALTLEITEGVLLESASIQHDNLQGLRRLGIRIALDDFGTGYSALAYLKRFPIDIIKIDRSFISGMEEQRYDTALIQAILAMAKGMDLDLVAEGIETAGQRQLLRLLGCHYGQGFLFARPAPADEAAPDATF